MARGKRGSKKQPKRLQSRRRRRGGRSSARSAAPRTSTIGGLVVKGVKMLATAVPVIGPILGKSADVFFKYMGITDSNLTHGTFNVFDASMTGMFAKFRIGPGSILSGSKVVTQTGVDSRQFITTLEEARIIELVIEVIPNNPVEKRSGELVVSFQPYYTPEDYHDTNQSIPLEESMRRQHVCVSGPAERVIKLVYRPRVCDGFAYMFHPICDTSSPGADVKGIGECTILYRNYSRDSFTEFKASEFTCQINISGSVEAKSSSGTSGYYTVDRVVKDFHRTSADDNLQIAIEAPTGLFKIKQKNYECAKSTDGLKCKVKGYCVKATGWKPVGIGDFEMVSQQ